MSLSTELFENAPVGIDGVIRQVIQIFGEHWQPLVMITGIQMIAFTGVFLVLGTLTRLLAASYILYLVSVLQTMITPFYYDYDHHDRNYYGDDQQQYDGQGTNSPDINIVYAILALIALIVLWVVVLSFVGSIFTGAFCHAVAEIYTGITPSPVNSVRKGIEKIKKVYLFQLILFSFVLLLILFTVVAPICIPDTNFLVTFLGLLSCWVAMISIPTLLVAGIPTIIVEGKEPVEALKRSFYLCKDFFFFIYSSQFCFHNALVIVVVMIKLILSQLGYVWIIIGHYVVNFAASTIAAL